MSDDDTQITEIAELAKSYTGARAVAPTTRLYADLGMTGDDAHAFMLAFAIKYDADMSGLVWLRYFDDESNIGDLMGPAIALAASILSPVFAVRWQAARDAEREITIAHLADVARAKVWLDPGEAFRRAPRSAPLTLMFSAVSLLVMAFFVLLGGVVVYAFLAGALGDQNLLALVGIAATSLLLPVFLAFASWRGIERKLTSAEGG